MFNLKHVNFSNSFVLSLSVLRAIANLFGGVLYFHLVLLKLNVFYVMICNKDFTFMQIFETLLRDVKQLKQDVRKFTFIMLVISIYRNRSKGSAITQNIENMIRLLS